MRIILSVILRLESGCHHVIHEIISTKGSKSIFCLDVTRVVHLLIICKSLHAGMKFVNEEVNLHLFQR